MKKQGLLELEKYSDSRMLIAISWPIILSLLVQGLYSLVDSYFLARLGEQVLSAVSLSFVVQNLTAAFFSGVATGINAIISRSIGASRPDDAKSAVASGFVVQAFFVLITTLFGIFAVPLYFSRSSSNPYVIQYGTAYLSPLLTMSIFSCFQITAERLLQSSGESRYMFYSQVVGTLINCILDPLLIFGFAGMPAMGVVGAAYATLTGQFAAAATAIYFNIRKNPVLFDNFLENAKVSGKIAGEVCRIGIPSSAIGIAGSIGNYCINRIMIGFLDTANAAFGIYTKVQSVCLMPTQGIGTGLVTQIAFFLGKKDVVRLRKSLIAGMIIVGIWNFIVGMTFVLIPSVIMAPFNPSPSMLEYGLPCFRIIGLTWFFSGYMLCLNSFLQATGWSVFTLFVSISRQIAIRTPVAIWLSTFNKPELIWWSWPISELVSDLVCLSAFLYVYKKILFQMTGGI